MKTRLTLLAGSLALVLGGAAIAQDTTTDLNPATTPETLPADPLDTAPEMGEDVLAPPPGDPLAATQPDWSSLDTNSDGVLSESEIQADTSLSAVVDTWDTDGDGQISRVEFDAWRGSDGVAVELDDGLDGDVEFDSDIDGELDPPSDTDLTADVDTDFEADVDVDDEL